MCIHRYIQRAWRCFSLPLPDLLTFWPSREGHVAAEASSTLLRCRVSSRRSWQCLSKMLDIKLPTWTGTKKPILTLTLYNPVGCGVFFFTPFLKLLSDPCHTVDPWPLRGNPATMVPGPFHRTGQESLEVWPGAAGDECRLPENDCQGVWWVGPIKALTNYMLLLSYYIII